MEWNNLYLGDCTKLIDNIESNSVHCIISDIPYGIGYEDWDILHNNTNSALKQQQDKGIFKRRGKPLNGWANSDRNISKEYGDWVKTWVTDWFRVVKPGSSVFVFAGRQFAHRVILEFENAGFTFKDMLAWKRNNAPHRAQRISEVFKRRNDLNNSLKWEGWRLANLRPLFEPILWFQKPYPIGTTLTDNVLTHEVGAWNEKALLKYNISGKPNNILKVVSTNEDKGLHPTQKPLNLLKLLIELVTIEEQKVLDPFAGSGTTLIASLEINRLGIGFEKDEDIFNIAQQRLKEITL